MKYSLLPVFILSSIYTLKAFYMDANEPELNNLNNSKVATSKANDEVNKEIRSKEDVNKWPTSTENDIYISIGIRTKANAKIHTKIVSNKDGNVLRTIIENEVGKASEITSEVNDKDQTKIESNKIFKDLTNTKDKDIDISIEIPSKANHRVHTKFVSNEQTKECQKTKDQRKITNTDFEITSQGTIKENEENGTDKFIQTISAITQKLGEEHKDLTKIKENEGEKVVKQTTKPETTSKPDIEKTSIPNDNLAPQTTVKELEEHTDGKLIEITPKTTVVEHKDNGIGKVIALTPKPTVEATPQPTAEPTSPANIEATFTEKYFDETTPNYESEDEEDKKLDEEIAKLNITVEKLSNLDDEVTDSTTWANYEDFFTTEPNWWEHWTTSSTEEPINWWSNDQDADADDDDDIDD